MALTARPKNALRHGYRSEQGRGKQHPLYTCWMNLRSRCNNPKNKSYADYGGRGIYHTPRWTLFENFVADMGPRPDGGTIERIDVDGPYYKENCRWATRAEQNVNKRNCVRYEFDGQSLTLPEWARRVGIKRSTLVMRIHKYGWELARALTVPAQPR